MPAELSIIVFKIIIALLKKLVENVVENDAIDVAGNTLIDIGGEKIQGKIDAIFATNEGSRKLIDAALRADSYFREKCSDKDLRDIFTMPMGDLPSTQAMLVDLPNALDQAGALKTLSENLEVTFPRLKKEQIDYCATLYLDCLNKALLPLKDFTLPIIGQTVLESKEDIKDIKRKMEELLEAIAPRPAKECSKLFICYRRSARDDSAFAEYLHSYFTARGHEVFIDISMRVGTEWLKKIDAELKTSDYLIVLVSKNSTESEMVHAEMQRAYEYRHQNGFPKTLPIRMKYKGMLPYTIAAFIGQIQQIDWNGFEDNERVADEIFRVIVGQKNPVTIAQKRLKATSFSEDGHAFYSITHTTPPLPSFDPRILDELEEPGGSLKLDDKFYIERDSDEKLRRNIAKNGTTITIRASRQTGKSSLLVRGIHHVRASANVVYLDLQSIEHSVFESADGFLKYFAGAFARKLRLDIAMVNQVWRERLGPQDKLVKVMEEYILPRSDRQIVLAIDEADRLLEATFYSDFFALLRFWHNNRAIDPLWNKLNLAMVIATEPYLLISNPNQSPFNVGIKLNLEDFSRDQVRELNLRHGEPIKEAELDGFFSLLNGHPYLTRKALYLLVSENQTWKNLDNYATDDLGPFGDNLRRQLWFIHESDVLRSALRQVINHNKSENNEAVQRLMRAGLIKGIGDRYFCRCGLYERYFRKHLK